MGRDFRKELSEDKVMVIDGAMGSMLYSRGVYINQSFEEINLKNPDLVRSIHQEYFDAGADIMMTNTYTANSYRLEPYGMADQVTAVNEAAVAICRSVAGDKVFVAGSMGPTGKHLSFDKIIESRLYECFQIQAKALIESSVDLMILETFSDKIEMNQAIRAVRDLAPDMPIIAMISFGVDGTTYHGDRPEEMAKFLESHKVDAIGANCSTGPHAMLDTVQRMIASAKTPVGAMPNAGAPRTVDGRTLYMATPDYFRKFAKKFINVGTKIIGGCCGTTPEMIHEVVISSKALGSSRIQVMVADDIPQEEKKEPLPVESLTPMSRRFAENEFVVSVEVRPPRGITANKLLDGLAQFKDCGINMVNIPDSARATVSMSPMALSLLIREQHGIESIIHYSCRDRNLLGMQSDLLGLHALDIRDVLVITGDPPKMGNYPDATAVFDVDAIGLTKIIDNMNHGLDLGGKALKSVTGFHNGVGVDPGAIEMEREIKRFRQKVEAGAKYVMTQPVFDPELFLTFMNETKDCRIKTMVGIQPFASHKNCEFFHHEVPGVSVPQKYRDIMEKAGSGPKAKREGVAIAKECLDAVREHCDGVYVMAPLGLYNMALAVLNRVPIEDIK